MNRRAFMGLGATFITVGALQRSGAFRAVDADRGIRISTVADSSAIVGLVGNDDPATTPEIINNSNELVTVTLSSATVAFDVNDNGIFKEPATFDLKPAKTKKFKVDGDDGSVTISADLANNGEIIFERPFIIPKISGIRKVTGSVNKAGNSGKYKFSLPNDRDETLTLDGF